MKTLSHNRRYRFSLYCALLMLLAMSRAVNGQSVASITNAETKQSSSDKRPSGRANTTPPNVEDRLKTLEEQLRQQSAALIEMRATITEQQRMIEIMSAKRPGAEPPAPNSTTVMASDKEGPKREQINVTVQKTATQETAPLSLRIGSAYITPVGFMDFTAVFRSTAPGSGIGTNFGSIPFNNVPSGKLTELRMSAQNSRIGLRVDAKVKDAKVIGYLESDFLGVLPGNAAVSSNSNSLRLRVYWVDVTKGKFELMGGQSWSMLTPNRKGLSPLPSDLFYTQNVDVNYQAGLVWSRDPQIRFVYHPNKSVAMGVSLENPEQYIGGSAGGGLITLPSALATAYSSQLSNGNSTLTTPNLHPDIIGKIAFDRKIGARDFHLELAGLARSFRTFNPLDGSYHSARGVGGSVNLNVELVKNFRLVSNNYYSDGGGRWIFGQAPDLIVRGDGSISPVHAGSTVTGFEYQARKNTLLYGYYGGVYIQRNVATDPANGKPIGYGYPSSPSGQNRTIQEGTFGFTQTFWRDPKYGALQLMGQYSYLTRRPWFVTLGQPNEAHSHIVFINLRYLLPGSAPKID